MFGVTGRKKGAGRLRQGEVARIFTADELDGAVAVGLGSELVVILGPKGDIVEQVGQVRQVPTRDLKNGETVLIASAITITINFLLGSGKAPKGEKAFRIDDAVTDAGGSIVNSRVRVDFKVDTGKFGELGRRTQQEGGTLKIEDVQRDIRDSLVSNVLRPAFGEGKGSLNDPSYLSPFTDELSRTGFFDPSLKSFETAPESGITARDVIRLGRTRWPWFDALRVVGVLLSIASSTVGLLFWTTVLPLTPALDTPLPPPPESTPTVEATIDIDLARQPSIQLSIADETVKTGEETSITVALTNPLVNDASIEGEVQLRIGGGGIIRLDAPGEDTSGIAAASFEPPIEPGEARTFRFKVSAGSAGSYPLTGNAQYWPEGSKSGAASLALNGSISVVD